MAKFYKSAQFKLLQDEWRGKLRESGFEDVERPNDKIKGHNRRTQAWLDRDVILEQTLKIQCFLTEHGNSINPRYRLVLELYVEGTRINQIAKQSGYCRYWVRQIIARYK